MENSTIINPSEQLLVSVNLSTELEPLVLTEPQLSCPVIHTLAPKMYIREVHLPKGAFILGNYHTTLHQNIMLKGELDLIHEDGSATRIVAPYMCTGSIGRKMAFIIEDTVWLNLFSVEDEEQDIEVLEARFMDRSEAFLQARDSAKVTPLEDIEDFSYFLECFQLDRETVQAIPEDTSDLIKLPYGSYKFKIADSTIAGKGVFATANIASGELIGASRIGNKRTSLGRYLNHAKEPNATMIRVGEDILLIATKELLGCFGGLDGEEITVNYADVLQVTHLANAVSEDLK